MTTGSGAAVTAVNWNGRQLERRQLEPWQLEPWQLERWRQLASGGIRRRYYGGGYYDDGAAALLGLGLGLGLGSMYNSTTTTVTTMTATTRRAATIAQRLSSAHVQWCYNRYRSYRAWDNTFQPYNGPRQQC